MEPGTEHQMKGGVTSAHPVTVLVTVNTKPVELPKRRISGLEIKQAAIAQGVNIQPDFVLFRVKAHGKRDPIRDDEKIEPHRGDEFEAVPGDDNS
jgi:hypothetical protein